MMSAIDMQLSRFNSPFGILFVRTPGNGFDDKAKRLFQFPIRNSVRSDVVQQQLPVDQLLFQFPIRNSVRSDIFAGRGNVVVRNVSIPHSEFCSFGLQSPACSVEAKSQVSIPHSEFCSFGRLCCAWTNTAIHIARFNSPFGILFVRTGANSAIAIGVSPFQFPIRNSVRSDSSPAKASIVAEVKFQFPIRNSVRSDLKDGQSIDEALRSFQFPIRNSVRSDGCVGHRAARVRVVSIPHSEFCSFGRF